LKAGWLDGTLTKSGQQLELGSTVILKGHTLEQPLKYTIPFQISKWVTEHLEGDSKTSRIKRDSRSFLQTRNVESSSICKRLLKDTSPGAHVIATNIDACS